MVSDTLPRWDMAVVFPSLESPEFNNAVAEFSGAIDSLKAVFDREDINKGSVEADPTEKFERALAGMNGLMEKSRTLNAYISAFVTTDSRNETAQAAESSMDMRLAKMRKLQKRLTAWVGSQDVSLLLGRSDLARQHEYWIRKAAIGATKMLPAAEEDLVSDLELTGKAAWSKLQGTYSSQIEVKLGPQTLPISAVRALAYDSDPEKRRTAYECELAAWKEHEVPLSAAMNGIKGEVSVLCDRRGWDGPLQEALFGANIDEETLEAMLAAARESFPIFRRYLRAKAKALGKQSLPWYDIFAPLGASTRSWEYGDACEFVVEQFGSYSDKLAGFAKRAFQKNWIDVPSMPGKQDGAYCMGILRDESRIFMNWKPAFGSAKTLAHELGHGYHNLCLAERTSLQRSTPMTLAETASIFCETIVREAVLAHGDSDEQLDVLEASLCGANQVVVDITSRYLFESGVFAKRGERELSAAEMCEIMLDAQRQTYGDGLDQDLLHPYMWAAKPHYYSGRSFYNFPYMFGLLFGLGLYEVYRQEPKGFHERYDDLLSSTGLADAWTLGQRFGIDIRSPEFWRASLRAIERDVERFETLIG
jgi:pepF/M3 family oligoendopeptidase